MLILMLCKICCDRLRGEKLNYKSVSKDAERRMIHQRFPAELYAGRGRASKHGGKIKFVNTKKIKHYTSSQDVAFRNKTPLPFTVSRFYFKCLKQKETPQKRLKRPPLPPQSDGLTARSLVVKPKSRVKQI